MYTRILTHGALAVAAAILLLTMFWLLLPSAGQASPILEAPTTVTPLKQSPPPTPDPRWLALIQAPHPHHLAAQQINPPSINVHLTDGFVAGRAAIAATVVVSVTRDGSQVAHDMVAPVPVDDGFFYLAYPNWSSNSYAAGGGGNYDGIFQAGDVVWVSQTGVVVSMTIPALSALAATDSETVYGTAPISEPVTVYLFPFATPDTSYTHTVTADGAGSYLADFTPTDLRPHQGCSVLGHVTPFTALPSVAGQALSRGRSEGTRQRRVSALLGGNSALYPTPLPFRRNSETCFVSFRGRRLAGPRRYAADRARPRNLVRAGERFRVVPNAVPLRGTRNDIPGGSDCHAV